MSRKSAFHIEFAKLFQLFNTHFSNFAHVSLSNFILYYYRGYYEMIELSPLKNLNPTYCCAVKHKKYFNFSTYDLIRGVITSHQTESSFN